MRLPQRILDELFVGLSAFCDRQDEHLSGVGCPGFIWFDSISGPIAAIISERPLTFWDVAGIIREHTAGAHCVPISALAASVLDVCRLVQAAERKHWDETVDAKNRAAFGEEWYRRNHVERE